MKYQVLMERFWGLQETVSIHSNVQDAIKALQLKKSIILASYPQAVFTIESL